VVGEKWILVEGYRVVSQVRVVCVGLKIEVDSMRIPHVVHLIFLSIAKCASMLTLMTSPTTLTNQMSDLNEIFLRKLLKFLVEASKLL
jgi:uncharacterized protein YlxW (UPF0749 family)